jgi:predicted  nucleic acid-binding Zn-ribbon protein
MAMNENEIKDQDAQSLKNRLLFLMDEVKKIQEDIEKVNKEIKEEIEIINKKVDEILSEVEKKFSDLEQTKKEAFDELDKLFSKTNE